MHIARHEAWRLDYRANRYLRDLTDLDVLARAGHIATNLLTHSSDGRLAVKPLDADSTWMQRYTHVLEELVIRCIDSRNQEIVNAMNSPIPKSPKVIKALKKLANRNWPKPIIAKFGKREYTSELLLYGRGRISLASTYNDTSLGYARADDESHVTGCIDPSNAHRFMVGIQEGNGIQGFDVDVPYLGSVSVEVSAKTPFYICCLAEAIDPRLFDDFSDADSCVIITDPDHFKRRLVATIAEQLPGWRSLSGAIVYFDPFFCRAHNMVPHFWKHFRYSYQKEHRLVWHPPTIHNGSAPVPDHIYFDLGPLTNCAEFFWL